MKEKIFFSVNEFIELDIPENSSIGVMMSGGTDSSLLAYLLAHTIQKHQLQTKVFPITAELLSRPYNLKHSAEILLKIKELTGFEFEIHLGFPIANHRTPMKDEEKIAIKSLYTSTFMTKFELKILFNGLTTNPPEADLPSGPKSHRHAERDSYAWKQQMKNTEGLAVPFIDIDKRGIGLLYKKFNLLNNLFPITRSCEGEFLETQYHTKNCYEVQSLGNECFWCRERQFGFANL
jgi:hypothetical protein